MMQRAIAGFRQDTEGHWVAELSCHHAQHMRHNPPFTERAWVIDKVQREGMKGQLIACDQCDRLQLPDGLQSYRQTPDFDATTVPKGLLRDHSTKAGVWGRLEVLRGQLVLSFSPPIGRDVVLKAGQSGVIPPEALHHVRLDDDAGFRVVFLHRSDDLAGNDTDS